MYCSNCGKQIENSNFCPHCGEKAGTEGEIVIKFPKKNYLTAAKEYIKKTGHKKLFQTSSVVSTLLSIVIRFLNSEIKTVIHVFAADDLYTITETGRNLILGVLLIHIVFSAYLLKDAKNSQVVITRKQIFVSVILFIISVLAIVLDFHAA